MSFKNFKSLAFGPNSNFQHSLSWSMSQGCLSANYLKLICSLLRNQRKKGFPDSSVGKESACNAGDPGSIPGSGRSTGEGNGYPLQYSWASLVSHLVKNPPAMWETWIPSLGWEDPLEKGMATHPSVLAGEFQGLLGGSQRVRHSWETFAFTLTLVSLK